MEQGFDYITNSFLHSPNWSIIQKQVDTDLLEKAKEKLLSHLQTFVNLHNFSFLDPQLQPSTSTAPRFCFAFFAEGFAPVEYRLRDDPILNSLKKNPVKRYWICLCSKYVQDALQSDLQFVESQAANS